MTDDIRIILDTKSISSWTNFKHKTIELDNDKDNPKPHGWNWFWALYYLQDAIPNFDFEKIKDMLPDDHWLNIEEKDKKVAFYKTADGEFHYKTPLKRASHQKIQSWVGKIDLIGKITEIDFSKITFNAAKDTPINFSNFIFPVKVLFKKSGFSQDALFIKAVFLETANFNSTVFSKDARFDDAIFFNTANFESAKFANAQVHNKLETYKKTAKFRNTIFKKIANFRDATFWRYANFKGATFGGRTAFQEAKFKSNAPRFYGATFNNEMTWAGIELPNFDRADDDYFEEDEDNKVSPVTDEKVIEENCRRRIEENQNSYENTSILLGNEKKDQDQHLFFREEMRCRRWLEENRFISLAYKFYEDFADYGYGVDRAFKAWAWHIAYGIGAIMLMVGACVIVQAICGNWQGKLHLAENLLCAIPVSFINANPVAFIGIDGGGLMDCYDSLKKLNPLFFGIIRVTQTLVGIALLFLLLTTLRVRFRIK